MPANKYNIVLSTVMHFIHIQISRLDIMNLGSKLWNISWVHQQSSYRTIHMVIYKIIEQTLKCISTYKIFEEKKVD